MNSRTRTSIAALVALAAWASPSWAQADLSGVWMRNPPGNGFSEAAPPAMTPWALEAFAANRPTVGPRAALDANDPTLDCAPPGMPYLLAVPVPFEIVHAGGQILQLFEYNHFVRRIHMDGRPHPPDLQATGVHAWLGHAIGQWNGDTLAVDTTGFNDATWLDRLGHPHTDALRVRERIRRADHDTLEYEVTVDDPGAYAGPWTGHLAFTLREDWQIFEHVCMPAGDAYRAYKQTAWDPIRR